MHGDGIWPAQQPWIVLRHWFPDAYSRVIWPIVALVWIATASGVLYTRSPSAPPVAAPAATPGFRARDVTA